jgi:hypothetical protein
VIGQRPFIPRSEVDWALLSVGAESRSLLISYRWGGGYRNEPEVMVEETANEIRIAITLPDLTKDPRTQSIEHFAAVGRATVQLSGPVSGRRVSGPRCILADGDIGSTAYRTVAREGTLYWVVPNVVGLNPADAIWVLRLQGFQPKITGSGRTITTQSPPVETVSPDNEPEFHGTVTLVAGDFGD